MNVLQALRPGSTVRIAFTGAGGKTTAVFQLAHQLLTWTPEQGLEPFPAVIVTCTTHLAAHQLAFGNQHYVIATSSDLARLASQPLRGIVILTGPAGEGHRMSGLTGPLLDEIRAVADSQRLPLLVEADGSRQRPLKAPAGHEPPIPPWVDMVVVTAGLSGLGQPLESDHVHRPELFAALTGLALGSIVQPEHLAQILVSPLGGLKNIPPGIRRAALLNQADSPELQSAGLRLAENLAEAYPLILIAALAPADGATGQVYAAIQPVAGIVLAAGAAARFGSPKQLMDFEGEPLVRRAARTALAAGLDPVFVVTGAYTEQTTLAVRGLPVRLVDNPDWAAGQGASVAAGVRALPVETGAAFFLLADQPFVPVTLLKSLAARHAQTLAPITAPLVDGQRGNPVLFDRQTFAKLAELHGDAGGRALYSAFQVDWLPWHDHSLLLDIDRLEDYQRLVGAKD